MSATATEPTIIIIRRTIPTKAGICACNCDCTQDLNLTVCSHDAFGTTICDDCRSAEHLPCLCCEMTQDEADAEGMQDAANRDRYEWEMGYGRPRQDARSEWDD